MSEIKPKRPLRSALRLFVFACSAFLLSGCVQKTYDPDISDIGIKPESNIAKGQPSYDVYGENTSGEAIKVSESPEDSDNSETEDVSEDEVGQEEDLLGKEARIILDDMTLHEKICQMFVVTPESLTNSSDVVSAGESTKIALEKYPVGGIIYNETNISSSDQLIKMISDSQSYSKLGLLTALDEEGGNVNRLMKTLGTTRIGPMYSYKDEGAQKAYDNASVIGTDVAAYGFNTDLAPVADVWTNPENTVIGDRAYSDDFEQAAELVASAVRGFHDAGIICVLKHFPGHGSTEGDSHSSSVYVYKTEDELMQEEWLPFISGIASGADMVMIGHINVPEIDDAPATVSYAVITKELREKLGFDGVVITDSLQMSAVSELYKTADLAVRAIEAGADILLEPASLSSAVEGVSDSLERGDLSEDRINESVLRILKLKLKYGIIDMRH